MKMKDQMAKKGKLSQISVRQNMTLRKFISWLRKLGLPMKRIEEEKEKERREEEKKKMEERKKRRRRKSSMEYLYGY